MMWVVLIGLELWYFMIGFGCVLGIEWLVKVVGWIMMWLNDFLFDR